MKRTLWLLLPVAAVALGACNGLFRTRPAADNSRCHVCHINYSEEPLAVLHAQENIGCEKCHGPSDGHCGSESHEIAPDIIYPRTAVIPACLKCHTPRDMGHRDKHAPVLAPNPEKVCTDCHGTHRLAKRLIRWDKATRRLLDQ